MARARLETLARAIRTGPDTARREARQALRRFFCDLAGLPEAIEGTGPAYDTAALPDGLALAPVYAGLCLEDGARIATFVQGVAGAIRTAHGRLGRRVRVLYAGTGPFAPLAMLALCDLPDGAAGFTLIDAHPLAVEGLGRVVGALGAAPWIDGVICADAGSWRPAPGASFDVIVAEVMQRALEYEPQVALTRHLAQFLAPGGLWVPEAVSLRLGLADRAPAVGQDPPPGADLERDLDLGEVFRLTACTAAAPETSPGWLPAGRVTAPPFAGPPIPAEIRTEITVFGDARLADADCTLTEPCWLDTPPVRPGQGLACRFRLGEHPELVVTPTG